MEFFRKQRPEDNPDHITARIWDAVTTLRAYRSVHASTLYNVMQRRIEAHTSIPSDIGDVMEDSFRNHFDMSRIDELIDEGHRVSAELRKRSDFECSRRANVYYTMLNIVRGALSFVLSAPVTPQYRPDERQLAVLSRLTDDVVTFLEMAKMHGSLEQYEPLEESQPIKTS